MNIQESSKRLVHWIVAAAFFTLLLTGLPLLVPSISGLASDSWTRLIHRVAAIIFMSTPLIYALTHRSTARQWLRESLYWNKKTSRNPDSWKSRHKTLISISFILFVLTGMLQWFLKGIVPSGIFQFSLMIHDVTLYFSIVVLLYHIYHEFDWWLWKRRYCRQCCFAYCANVCPTKAISLSLDGIIERHPLKCNNCRLCMDDCRRNSYYQKSIRPIQAKNEVG